MIRIPSPRAAYGAGHVEGLHLNKAPTKREGDHCSCLYAVAAVMKWDEKLTVCCGVVMAVDDGNACAFPVRRFSFVCYCFVFS